ncbi:MAG: P44/Msp2 family outer membrane protein [Ehrlichia sp.]
MLLLPAVSFAENNYNYTDPVLYISGQCRSGISHFSQFSVNETYHDTRRILALKKSISDITSGVIMEYGSYDPVYSNTNSYVAEFGDDAVRLSGAVGFSYSEGLRIEMEVSYEKFDVKNLRSPLTDAHRYLALIRTSAESDDAVQHFAVMRNDGLSIGSVMINGCYDFTLDDVSALPYICGGIGGDFIEFFDQLHVKLAYQGKVGISYPIIHSKISLFFNGYYHGVIGDKFKNLRAQYVCNEASYTQQHHQVTSAVATLHVSYFGGEIGARFMF